jgi:hypothetical protein
MLHSFYQEAVNHLSVKTLKVPKLNENSPNLNEMNITRLLSTCNEPPIRNPLFYEELLGGDLGKTEGLFLL